MKTLVRPVVWASMRTTTKTTYKITSQLKTLPPVTCCPRPRIEPASYRVESGTLMLRPLQKKIFFNDIWRCVQKTFQYIFGDPLYNMLHSFKHLNIVTHLLLLLLLILIYLINLCDLIIITKNEHKISIINIF